MFTLFRRSFSSLNTLSRPVKLRIKRLRCLWHFGLPKLRLLVCMGRLPLWVIVQNLVAKSHTRRSVPELERIGTSAIKRALAQQLQSLKPGRNHRLNTRTVAARAERIKTWIVRIALAIHEPNSLNRAVTE